MTELLPAVRTMAILRGASVADAAATADRCWEAGIDLVEVPVQNERAFEALDAVVARADGRPVGAGTVIDVERARRSIDAGAGVLVMPGVDEAVIDVARQAGVAVLPGVMTPTDVMRCVRAGVEACKLFPASVLGVAHLGALRPVFPEVGFVATGGIGPANAADFVAAGVRALAFGGAIDEVLSDPGTLAAAADIAEPWRPRPPRPDAGA